MRGGRVRRYAALAAGLLCLWQFGSEPAAAEVRIRNDPGGLISDHMHKLTVLAASGEPVVIDGPCYSACTLVLGMIPRERLCVTARAQLGFHAAWAYAPDGTIVASHSGTESLMRVYPASVRRWIARKGGLSRKMIFLSGRELRAMYRACR